MLQLSGGPVGSMDLDQSMMGGVGGGHGGESCVDNTRTISGVFCEFKDLPRVHLLHMLTLMLMQLSKLGHKVPGTLW